MEKTIEQMNFLELVDVFVDVGYNEDKACMFAEIYGRVMKMNKQFNYLEAYKKYRKMGLSETTAAEVARNDEMRFNNQRVLRQMENEEIKQAENEVANTQNYPD